MDIPLFQDWKVESEHFWMLLIWLATDDGMMDDMLKIAGWWWMRGKMVDDELG